MGMGLAHEWSVPTGVQIYRSIRAQAAKLQRVLLARANDCYGHATSAANPWMRHCGFLEKIPHTKMSTHVRMCDKYSKATK